VGLKHVFLCSNKLAAGQNLISGNAQSYNMIGDVLVDVPFGEYVMREFDEHTTNHQYYMGFHNVCSFDLALYSEGTTNLAELNGLPWSVVLEVFSSGA
jgi:hypothetical protein